MPQTRNYDNDRTYRNPRAWAKMKRIFGRQFGMDELAQKLEELAGSGCPRLLMACALHQFVTQAKEERARAVMAYHDAEDAREKALKEAAQEEMAPTSADAPIEITDALPMAERHQYTVGCADALRKLGFDVPHHDIDIRNRCSVQCTHCGQVFRTTHGINKHLARVHGLGK